jgi:hypothetical protein
MTWCLTWFSAHFSGRFLYNAEVPEDFELHFLVYSETFWSNFIVDETLDIAPLRSSKSWITIDIHSAKYKPEFSSLLVCYTILQALVMALKQIW